MSENLFETLASRAAQFPAKTAMEWEGCAISFAELFARSARAANVLRDLGVQPGDRVALQIDKCPDAIVLVLACLQSGAALLPLNVAYTAAETEYFLGDSEPVVTVCRPERLEATRAIAGKLGLTSVESLSADGRGTFAARIDAASDAFASVPRAADDLAAILYTSGTTGRSKGAMLTHDNLASNARTLVDLWRFTPEDVLIHALPVFHTHGLFVATNVALLSGATMIFQPRFDPEAVMAAMPRATSLMGVPTFYVRLLEHAGLTRASTAHIRLFVSGSAPLLAETHEHWRERTGQNILERYGMTETNMITSKPMMRSVERARSAFPFPASLCA